MHNLLDLLAITKCLVKSLALEVDEAEDEVLTRTVSAVVAPTDRDLRGLPLNHRRLLPPDKQGKRTSKFRHISALPLQSLLGITAANMVTATSQALQEDDSEEGI